MEIQVGRFGAFGRPFSIGPPAVGTRLERGGAPARLFALTVEIVAEERSLDRLAVLPRGLVTAQRDQPDAVALGCAPLAVIPRACDHVIRVVDRKSTRLNSSHGYISYAVFCLKKKKKNRIQHVCCAS